MAVRYIFKNGERNLDPSTNQRIFPSVRGELQKHCKDGKTAKKACYQVTTDLGGLTAIQTSREIPKVAQAYEIQRAKNKKEVVDDPLKKLILKQLETGKSGDGVIQKITHNQFSYDIL